ncbi:multicopper oxidase domain-containing protein [Pontibacillus yanchengensis]|uniref:Multicopper oxidase domain-containing protein n=1 Tax=Pontibacillus yanchengensis TaxID=462910 RepID=A0ACC7VCJ4_9BACI|nr:multicopper oxidase family protein [Pontibacillus yanchengensis]MYL52706.1 multicopper oxidase domain-containing protein [Pontibacillus yanchengensis]
MKNKIFISLLSLGIFLIGAWFVIQVGGSIGSKSSTKVLTEKKGTSIMDLEGDSKEGKQVKTFNITASSKQWNLNDETIVNAWTYNGTVPGEEIRVTEGDYVRVHLKNDLNVPVTIHWHGVVLPNKMDGVPGVTQDAVLPGEQFTYEFSADNPGTFWYHSHQHSSKQVDKGLYGALIVEEKEKQYQNDQTFIIDEWAVNQQKQNIMNMGSMMSGGMSGDGEADTKAMYDTLSINGKSGNQIDQINMKKGEKGRLRFINAGYQTHYVNFPDQSMKIVAVDGEDIINSSPPSTSLMEIAPGERIDVEFTKTNKTPQAVTLLSYNESTSPVSIPVKEDSVASKKDITQNSSINKSKAINSTTYKSEELLFTDLPKSDVQYTMELNMGMNMGEGMVFQINNDIFPNTAPIQVTEGDIVKVTLKNTGMLNHPMHLHGHRFQVVAKNGEPLENPVVKDLLNVKPGQTYEIYFKANNAGEWLFHCHDNNHADRGMVTILDYKNVYSPFKIGGDMKNKP